MPVTSVRVIAYGAACHTCARFARLSRIRSVEKAVAIGEMAKDAVSGAGAAMIYSVHDAIPVVRIASVHVQNASII
jgi:hypothetical protein